MAKDDLPPAIEGVIGEVFSADQALQLRASKLMDRAMREAEKMLVEGTPAVKEKVVRSLMPAIAKRLEVQDETDARFEKMAADFQALMEAVRSSVADPRPLPQGEAQPPVDGRG